jgi:cyclophilin family peptidyl-prolyl cis-trans isomerase
MKPIRRLAAFTLVLGVIATTACAPLNRAKTQALAARDTLVHTRDSLARTRTVLAQRDSVFLSLAISTPDSFLVTFETTRGRFDVMAHSRWAPVGTDRFYELVHRRFYDSVIVYRVMKGFVAQFGLNGDPAVSAAWRNRRIADDPVVQGNKRGRLAFARQPVPGTRTTQVYINFADNPRLDTLNTFGFAAFAEVVRGMEVVDSLNAEYGGAPSARQDSISRQGNAYLLRAFPKLDMIKTARIVQEWRRPPG